MKSDDTIDLLKLETISIGYDHDFEDVVDQYGVAVERQFTQTRFTATWYPQYIGKESRQAAFEIMDKMNGDTTIMIGDKVAHVTGVEHRIEPDTFPTTTITGILCDSVEEAQKNKAAAEAHAQKIAYDEAVNIEQIKKRALAAQRAAELEQTRVKTRIIRLSKLRERKKLDKRSK